MSSTAPTDHYGVLGIDQFSSMETVRQAFRKLALKSHPDKQATNDSSEFIQINNSYKYLCQNKPIYDILLNQSSISDLPEKLIEVEDYEVAEDGGAVEFEC